MVVWHDPSNATIFINQWYLRMYYKRSFRLPYNVVWIYNQWLGSSKKLKTFKKVKESLSFENPLKS